LHTIIALALVCPMGSYERLDNNGHSVCVGTQTGQVHKIQGSLRDCPTGMIPLLTLGRSSCVDPRTGAAAHDIRRECRNATAKVLTTEGQVCR
jgi:hypothetical protein